MWGGAPRCDSSLAPGSASDWPTAGTDSRCEGNRAPGRKGRPLRGSGCGAGLRGATLLSHLEAQVTGRQRERTPGAKGNRAPGRTGWPLRGPARGVGAPRCDFSHAPGSASDWPTAGTDSRCEEESRTRESGMTRATGKGEKI